MCNKLKPFYTCYDGTDRAEPDTPDCRSVDGWRDYYQKNVDHEEDPDFDSWISDMIKMQILV